MTETTFDETATSSKTITEADLVSSRPHRRFRSASRQRSLRRSDAVSLLTPTMAQGVAASTLEAGHWLPNENPAFLAAQLAAFLGENGR
jgi:hypothetical protein